MSEIQEKRFNKRQRTIINKLSVLALAQGTGMNAYCAWDNLSNYTNTKAEILREYLLRAPELNEQVSQTAMDAVESISTGDLHSGLCSAALACTMGVGAIYFACKKEK
jgi:hypothetical protein